MSEPKVGVDDYLYSGGTVEAIIAASAADIPTTELPAPTAPLAVARVLVAEYETDDGLTLRWWRGDWLYYTGTHWAPHDPDRLIQGIYEKTEHEWYWTKDRNGNDVLKPWNPTPAKVNAVADALVAVTLLDRDVEPPQWLDGDMGGDSAAGVISLENGLLDVRTRELHPHTLEHFTTWSLGFTFGEHAPEPTRWLTFLQELWRTDQEAIKLLQEWFGYLISGRTDLQKILMMIGPPRGGKGITFWVAEQLLGKVNTCAPTLAALGQNFGLQSFIGKTAALITDARLGNGQGVRGDTRAITERLLSISGEDPLSVPRKNRVDWTGHLQTRIMIASNEVPRLADASGALVSRMLLLPLTESFLGREDPDLRETLSVELGGIFAWALDGLARLDAQGGHFTVLASGREEMALAEDLASPTKAFVEDRCVSGVGAQVLKDDLYHEWQKWSWDAGHEPGSKAVFVRNLRAAVRGVRDLRPRTSGDIPRPRWLQGIGLRAVSTVRSIPSPRYEDHPHLLSPAGGQEGPTGPGSSLIHSNNKNKGTGEGQNESVVHTSGANPDGPWTRDRLDRPPSSPRPGRVMGR
jgi:putative DNA primase/helicase